MMYYKNFLYSNINKCIISQWKKKKLNLSHLQLVISGLDNPYSHCTNVTLIRSFFQLDPIFALFLSTSFAFVCFIITSAGPSQSGATPDRDSPNHPKDSWPLITKHRLFQRHLPCQPIRKSHASTDRAPKIRKL